jgi:hypothetical protein
MTQIVDRVGSAFDRPIYNRQDNADKPKLQQATPSPYSVERLMHIVDNAIVCRANLEGLAAAVAEARQELSAARFALQRLQRDADRQHTELPPAAVEREKTLAAAYDRLRDRHEKAINELAPQVELAQRCEAFAREHRIGGTGNNRRMS